MKRQHWDPSDTQEQGVSGALATPLALASMSSNTPMTILANLRIPPPLEDSTVFTCFTNSSSLEELSSELKSSLLPTSSAARLSLHLQLLLQVEDQHLHHQPQLVDGEDSPASTLCCGGLLLGVNDSDLAADLHPKAVTYLCFG